MTSVRTRARIARAAVTTLVALVSLASPAGVRAATLTSMVADAKGEPIPQVVVHALPANGRLPTTPAKPSQMDQIDKEFVPFVQAVQLGAAVTFPNKDNIRHHVYSFSPAKAFDLKLYSGTSARPVVFDKVGPVTLGCNIHDWMVGHVYVVEGPWFGKTGTDGKVSIELPPGEYLVKVWHPWMKAEPAPVKVLVTHAAESRTAFRLDLTPPPATGHERH